MQNVYVDKDEYYIVLPISIMEKIVRYALTVCQDRCPSDRDPETCLYLVNLSKILGLGKPPCLDDYGSYSEKSFRRIIKNIEEKYRMKIQEFINSRIRKGPKSLDENIDLMEAQFALGVLNAMSSRRKLIIVKGSNIQIIKTSETIIY